MGIYYLIIRLLSSTRQYKTRQDGRRKARVETYNTYIFKVLRQVHEDLGISKKAMQIMNSFVADTFDKIAVEAGKLCRMNKKETLGNKEIMSAVRLVLPGELAKHSI